MGALGRWAGTGDGVSLWVGDGFGVGEGRE